MSNVSISHKIPIFGLLGENIYWILFEYLFLLQRTWFSSTSQTQPSKCLHYNSFLRPTHSTILQGHICNYQLDIYTWVLKHFILYITKSQLNFLLICLFSSMMEKQHSTLQNLTPSLNRALCNCSCTLSIFIALLLLHRPLLLLSNDWNNSSNFNAFLAWSHFKYCRSHLLKRGSTFIPALPLQLASLWLGMEHFSSGVMHSR